MEKRSHELNDEALSAVAGGEDVYDGACEKLLAIRPQTLIALENTWKTMLRGRSIKPVDVQAIITKFNEYVKDLRNGDSGAASQHFKDVLDLLGDEGGKLASKDRTIIEVKKIWSI